MKRHIYADNAATTRLDSLALDAMLPWLRDEYGNASQPYAFAREPKKALAEARADIAGCIGAFPEEIFFTSGGTESDNWVIKSSALSFTSKYTTLTSAFEHHAVLNACASIERLGFSVGYMYPTTDGNITVDILREAIQPDTRLVSVMFVNNELGSIQPIGELCELAHAYGALFHTDAVQAVGHIGIDVHELGVDMLSASAHKFNGPKGIGFLYIRRDVPLLPYIDGGVQEYGHRAGTENVPAIVGMAAALKANCQHIQQNQQHILDLEKLLISRLDEMGVNYHRNGGTKTLPGLLNLSFPGKDGEAILHRMDLMGISISTGSACDSVNTEISHVLRAIRLKEDDVRGTVRISLGKYNTAEEVETIAASLIRIVA